MANINRDTVERMRALLASWTVFYQQTPCIPLEYCRTKF
jgi:hypothetical protein